MNVNTSDTLSSERAKSISIRAKIQKERKRVMDYVELPHHHGEEEEKEAAMMQEQLNRVSDFQTVADIFRQLGDTTRIRIFWLLCHCEECVINISAMLEMSSPAVSHHLRPLKNSGLIICRRDGKEVYYRPIHPRAGCCTK